MLRYLDYLRCQIMVDHRKLKTIGFEIPTSLYEAGWRGTNFKEMLDQMFQHLYDNKTSRAIMKNFQGSFNPLGLKTQDIVKKWDYETFMSFMEKWKGEDN